MMAFVTHAFATRFPTSTRGVGKNVCAIRRAPVTMVDETSTTTTTTNQPEVANDASAPPNFAGVEPPSFDTTAFSDFVDGAQTKINEFVTKMQNIDGAELVEDLKTNGIGLIDNLVAGDWLNRGELYGAIQLAFVILLLRSPGILDGLVGFIVGPATLIAGATLSGKAVYDLGRKQLSIWPAPVPGAELKTEGLYSTIRHPVYAGLLLASLGFAVSTGSPERFALTLGMAAFLAKKIDIEEEYLGDEYEESWDQYCEEVPYKVIPKIW